MNSPISHLTEVLQKVKDSARTFEPQLKGNESATRAALVDPVLRALGWDIGNPGRVLVEKTQTVQKKSLRVDYALMHDQEIKIVVEAKKLGGDLKEEFPAACELLVWLQCAKPLRYRWLNLASLPALFPLTTRTRYRSGILPWTNFPKLLLTLFNTWMRLWYRLKRRRLTN